MFQCLCLIHQDTIVLLNMKGVFQKYKSKMQMTAMNLNLKKVFTSQCCKVEHFTKKIWLTFLRFMSLTVFSLFLTMNNALSGLFLAESIQIFLITLHHSSISIEFHCLKQKSVEFVRRFFLYFC